MYTAWDHADAYGNPYRDAALRMGAQLSTSTVWEDIETIRKHGNGGAHAGPYLRWGRMEADEEVFLAAMRLGVSFMVWDALFTWEAYLTYPRARL